MAGASNYCFSSRPHNIHSFPLNVEDCHNAVACVCSSPNQPMETTFVQCLMGYRVCATAGKYRKPTFHFQWNRKTQIGIGMPFHTVHIIESQITFYCGTQYDNNCGTRKIYNFQSKKSIPSGIHVHTTL